MQTIFLPQQSLASVSGNAQQWIACEQGTVWISDDGHDVVLQRGEKWQICSDRLVVIESLQESRLAIRSPQTITHSIWQLMLEHGSNALRHWAHRPEIKTI
ncbi:DUF2917 domain-containing protein [Chitinibacter bivalviorum]|uniref:DUF2917 domain-containing protein n=1 Tax=Chitinibacter bivalviorum TaxID=2739434 RepID=A0A7H9BGG8_9NEIS|nr:DUF2917 domain-containing protein [Chitinibacter bivalviorum]QLG87697.1 DUF2917 domain-containing protein [Chitinibacter bivalviorum]